uniref:Ion transport domain-containing protein n=2 Tax=Odontella aurita TaxID=265563 RepID=A0A7S4J5L2_9STRA|mmetsp:Transcript_39151/g.117711  ORF Transcript_39151/g.117711 Transcript_39151/m.117711 type:complete len:342 (+) Transcript_39151:154-1179(+)
MPFIVTVGLVLGAFAQMYHIDATTSSSCAESSSESSSELTFCQMDEAFLKIYAMFVSGGVDEEAFTASTTAAWLTALFALLVVLLLLTVLIAIVTDSYVDVRKQSEVVFWWHRFNFVFEIDAMRNFLLCRGSYQKELRSRSVEEESLRDSGRIMFDIMRLEFGDPNDVAVYEDRKDAQRRWRGSSFFFSDAQDLEPSWIKRALLFLILPMWFLAGLITMGFLWPPQVREFLLCPSIPDKPARGKESTSDLEHWETSQIRAEAIESLSPQEVANAVRSKLEDDLQEMKHDLKKLLQEKSAQDNTVLPGLEEKTHYDLSTSEEKFHDELKTPREIKALNVTAV